MSAETKLQNRLSDRHRLVVAGLLVCVVYALLPRSAATQVMFAGIATATPVIALLSMRRRVTGRLGWWVLAAGSALIATGEIVDLIVVTLLHRPQAGATIDVIFLAAYGVQLGGLMSLLRAESVSRHQFGWFDATAVGVAVGTVVWGSLYRAIFGGRRTDFFDLLTRFGGACLGVALVVMALRLVVGSRRPGAGFRLLLAAFGAQLAMDSVAALWPGYRSGGRLDVIWAVGYVFIAGAFRVTGTEAQPDTVPSRLAEAEIRHTLALQTGVMVVLAGMIVIEVGAAVPLVNLMVVGVAWLVIVMITRWRVFGLLRLVGQASATENQRRLTAMVAASHDVIGLADPDGTVKYLSPSMALLTGRSLEEWIGRRFDLALTQTFGGLQDLPLRVSAMEPGETISWECSVASGDDSPERIVHLTVANQFEVPEVHGWVITAHDVSDHARLTAELRHQALHDLLTGLPNRGLLFDRIEHCLTRMSRLPDSHISVVLIDIDDFKAVNDSLGHDAGDELLQAVAERLSQCVRQGDTVARLGGDEFAILLEDADEDEAMSLAGRALECLALPVQLGAVAFAVRASAGVVTRHEATDAVALLRSADMAMYAAKREGKSQVTLYNDDMHQVALGQLELRMDLAHALDRAEFEVFYQPILDTRRNRISGAEALIRWFHPTRGLVSPADFIPVAEQGGHIRAIGEWVLRTACAEAAAWSDPSAYISVNVSAPQLDIPDFERVVLDALEDAGLEPERLMLEITESMLVSDSSVAQSLLVRLRRHGIRIAIDDFGTGYSSLSYLREFSADVIKIDQSFVRDIADKADNQSLTRTILDLAQGLNMTTIAEGVETDLERDEITRLGCTHAQGYLFSRPVTAEAVRRLIDQGMTDGALTDQALLGGV